MGSFPETCDDPKGLLIKSPDTMEELVIRITEELFGKVTNIVVRLVQERTAHLNRKLSMVGA